MDTDRVTELQRWEDSGAVWRIVARTSSTITVALFSCDGGEQVGAFTSDDPQLLEFVGDRDTNAD